MKLLPTATCVWLVLVCSAARGQVKLRLAPAAGAGRGGFLPARLDVDDPNRSLGGVARAVCLRRTGGGPTLLLPASIAPGSRQGLDVLLPAVSSQQTYLVRLLAEDRAAAPALAQAEVPIVWTDLDAVERARAELVDPPAYEGYIEELPPWSGGLLRNVLLAAVLGCVAMGGVLFARRAWLRLIGAAVVTAALTVAMLGILSRAPALLLRRPDGLVVVTCRRTASFSHAGGDLLPVYWRPRQMDEDAMIYSPGRGLSVTIQPTEVRVFRLAAPTTQPGM